MAAALLALGIIGVLVAAVQLAYMHDERQRRKRREQLRGQHR